jgi:hypothetical protein
VARVELLRAEREIPFQQDGSRVTFTAPEVVDYEVAAVTPA